MKEVSSKVFAIMFKPLKAKGVALDRIVAGTGVSVAALQDRNAWIDWSEYCAIMRNMRPHFTDDEYVEIGRMWMRSPGLKFAFVIARLQLSAMDFYRWMNKPKNGVGNQMFTCIQPTHTEPAENQIQMDLTLPAGYEQCWDFYTISRGNMEELPRLLGLPPATVEISPITNGARLHITVPPGTPFFSKVRRAVSWPFTARAAATELRAAHETLLERFEQLEGARTTLDRQATQLRTAYVVNDLIHGDLDLVRTLETVAKALVEQAGFAWVELSLSARDPDVAARMTHYGDPNGEVPLARALEARGGIVLGELRVRPRADADRNERDELLTFIVPTVVMAIQNALSYQALEAYRTGLEQLVTERTAELTQARDLLAGTVGELREAQGARQRFFGNISHEIRTPLSLILLAAGDIQARAGTLLDARSRGGLDAVSDSARKLVRLVDELLLLAAGQEDKLTLRRERTDLAALLGNLLAAWRPAAEAAGLELDAKLPTSLITYVDPTAIERVISNLVSNAVKYTPRGGRVEIELATAGDRVNLAVLDSGIGITDELAARLFGRFERAGGDETGRVSGTGLGLALVKQLVEAHGGTITATARATGGTALRVSLPLVASTDDAAPAMIRTAAPSRLEDYGVVTRAAITSGMVLTPPGVSRGTILLAEDDARLAATIAHLLADHYTVVVALDGFAALELVRKHQPQLLITDVDMPGMTGIELSRKFREATGDKLAPIVILSAVHDLGTRVAGLEAGAVDYVTKPFDPVELEARVAAQFRMRDLALRLHRAEQLSALGILTAGLAHELRNPANGIVNAMEPLFSLLPAELTHPDTGAGQLLEVMKGCADQIAFLARQLLSFRTGVGKLELRPADLGDLVRRALTLAERALESVDVRIDVANGSLQCAPPLMVQVLTNLIENAGHAAGAGGWVAIRTTVEGGRITVEVSDSGAGVPVELRDRVFEPFFTTKAPGVGTGLGLPLARDIVTRHGGVLEIRDRDARPVFVIDLPDDALSAHADAV